MVEIEYLQPEFRMKKENGRQLIFDGVRKLWVRLTPEEWVRQNFLQYLIKVKNYPASLIAVEKEIKLNELKKRCDIVVYKDEKPWMIVECKEMNIAMGEDVLMQVLRYNISIPSVYLIVTNGNSTIAWHLADGKAEEIALLPEWK